MRFSRIAQVAAASAVAFGSLTVAHAGIQVGGTRVIFDARTDKREASVAVRNKGETPYVIQTYVDDGQGGTTNLPFAVTPPLFRLEGGKEQLVLVRNVAKGNLPNDRESVYWLDVKEIPPAGQAQSRNSNTLKIAMLTRIKLFYRPAGLSGSPAEAPAQLKWSVVLGPGGHGAALMVRNPTPYHVTFSTIEVQGSQTESINADMVAPSSDLLIPIPDRAVPKVGPVKFAYTTINDFGAVTPAVQVIAQPAPIPVPVAAR
jgi:fimbrial chaperone protein